MDTTGTFPVLNVLSKNNILTAMNKFYSAHDFKSHNYNNFQKDMFMVSTGISDSDFKKLQDIKLRPIKSFNQAYYHIK